MSLTVLLLQDEALEEGAGSWFDEEQALEDAYEDEDVKAERVAMQAGATRGQIPCQIHSLLLQQALHDVSQMFR